MLIALHGTDPRSGRFCGQAEISYTLLLLDSATRRTHNPRNEIDQDAQNFAITGQPDTKWIDARIYTVPLLKQSRCCLGSGSP